MLPQLLLLLVSVSASVSVIMSVSASVSNEIEPLSCVSSSGSRCLT